VTVEQRAGPSPADSLSGIGPGQALRELDHHRNRRLIFVMLFRVVLITLVLGVTTLIYYLSETDLTTPAAIAVYAVIGVTYLLTLGYALALRSGFLLGRLGEIQLIGDLAVAAVIVHATGGAQSAYTFFFPVAIIGAALIGSRRAIVGIAASALVLFVAVSLLGWSGALPALAGQEFTPASLTRIELARALALNGAAIVGVGLLAINLGSQLQRTRTSLETQSSAAADLLTLHSDIVRSLTSGLITIDGDGRINSINETATRILAIEADAALGRPLGELVAPIAAALENLASTDQLFRTEVRLLRPGSDADLVLGVSVSPLFDRNHNPIGRVINFQDLSELRQMEQQVRQAERLAVIGRLAAGVAHEIRNPLASISGSIELLRSSPPGGDERKALMDIVTREVDRLEKLIRELLDYTNPRAPTKAPLDLASAIRDTASAFHNDRAVAELEVEVSGCDREVPVDADPEKLRQVLWNLLRNAAEAAESRVEVALELEADRAIVEIADDGAGISDADLERIFDPFFTTKEGGTGLGLAIVHNIVGEHGGVIRARNREAGGAIFRVELPYTGTSTREP
jgi:two-component system sensor histidine kinase PilS (NtrC family)